MKFPPILFIVMLFLSCSKDFNDCTLICGQYEGTTKVTIANAGNAGQDLATKNESVLFIEQSGDQFKIDNLIFSLDKNGEFVAYDTPEGKVRVFVKWETNTLILEEDFGNDRTSVFEGVKVN